MRFTFQKLPFNIFKDLNIHSKQVQESIVINCKQGIKSVFKHVNVANANVGFSLGGP